MAASPVRATWERHVEASPAAVWALMSDTERFNRAAGFDFRFEEQPQPDGSTRRLGTARFVGMTLRWEERPFQHRVNQWYRWERLFLDGPAERVVGTLRLRPAQGGTDLVYSVEVHPRWAVATPIAWFELNVRTKPTLTRVIDACVALLRGVGGPLEPAPPPLSGEARGMLYERLATLPDAAFASALGRFVEEAPLSEQDRISPPRLARAWGLPADQVATGCLAAVRAGVLTLGWELLCPLCLGPKQRIARLHAAGRVHCPSCNIRYDGTFADSVGVSFRTAPALRDFEVPVVCVGSPARTPAVLASDRAEPGQRASFDVELDPGLYRLRSQPPTMHLSLSAGPSGVEGFSLPFGGDAEVSGRLELRAGACHLEVLNQAATPLQVSLERRGLPPDTLTAGQLLELPGAAELLPEEALDPRLGARSGRVTVLAIERRSAASASVDGWLEAGDLPGARLIQRRDGQAVLTFDAAADALRAAREALRAGARVALSQGPVVELEVAEGRRAALGSAVTTALELLWIATPEAALLTPELARAPELAEALPALGAALDHRALEPAPGMRAHRLVFDAPASVAAALG